MSFTAFLFVAFVVRVGSASDFSKYLSEFNDFDTLSSSGVSLECVSDMAIFGISLANFAATVKACVDQGGCTDEQKKILDKNMFAAKQLDSFGKLPSGIMEVPLVSSGSYHECRNLIAPYKTHYCYANIAFGNSTDNFLEKLGTNVAVCMPDSCSERDIPLLLEQVIGEHTLPIKFPYAKCVPTSVKPTTAFWIFMCFMVFFVVWAVMASAVDYLLDKDSVSKDLRSITAIRIFLTFSFYTNASLLLNTQPSKKGTIRSMACIRFVSMAWVASGHVLGQFSLSDSLLPAVSILDPILGTAFTNAFLSVDTFFLLSGILVAYIFFKAWPSRKFVKNPLTWVMFYVHRYLRLTPPLMMFIGLFTVILPLTNGPWMASRPKSFLQNLDVYVHICQKYWWRNMLYINNFFGHDIECYSISWYLAVDTQLYIVAPLFLVTLYMSPVIGAVVLLLCCAASIAYTYVITFRDDLPSSELVALLFSRNERTFFNEFYEKPWVRCTPYLIGMGVGYFLARVKGKKLRLHWIAAAAMWVASICVSLLCLFGPHDYLKGKEDWSKFVRGSYNNFARIGWSLAVSWVIVANNLGWGGPVTAFMDHPLWQPLGRLSYCAYIVHFYIILYIFNLDDRPTHYVSIWQSYVYRTIPVVALCYLMAFFWSCLFEVPTAKLEKMLFESLITDKKTQTNDAKLTVDASENGTRHNNKEH